MIDRIVQSCPDRAIERFEEISYLIKNSDSVALEEFVRCKDERPYARHSDDMAAGTGESIEALRKMLTPAAGAAGGDGGEGEA